MCRSGLTTVAIVAGATLTLSAQQSSSDAAPQQNMPRTEARNTTGQRIAGLQPAPRVAGEQPSQMVLVTSPGSISANPSAFYGVPVSVHAQVGEASGAHTSTLEEDAWWRVGDDLLVVIPQPSGPGRLNEDDYVTVVGTVQPFVRTDVERDYDWFDFDNVPDLNIELEGRPMIVADLVRTSDGVNIAQPSRQMTRILVASPGEIAETPGRYYGRAVAVRQEIEDVWSPRVFTLDEDNWLASPDLLVFNPNPVALPGAFEDYDGERVMVYGTVRPFIRAEFEQDYSWFNATDYEDFGLDQWERRPVVIASSILTPERAELVSFRPDLALDRSQAQAAARAERWPEMSARWGRPATRQTTSNRPEPVQQRGGQSATTSEPQGRSGRQPSGDASGQQAVGTAGASGRGAASPITDLAGLVDGNPDQLFGRQVRISRIQVARVIDDRTYRLGSTEQRSVIVQVDPNRAPDVSQGDYVQLQGVVARPGEAPPISDAPFYVDARSVTPAR